MAVHQANITNPSGSCCVERRAKCRQSSFGGRATSHPPRVSGGRSHFTCRLADSNCNPRETAAVATDTSDRVHRLSQCLITSSATKWVADVAPSHLFFTALGVQAPVPWSIVEQLPDASAGHDRRRQGRRQQSHFVTPKWISSADTTPSISLTSSGHQSDFTRQLCRWHRVANGARYADGSDSPIS